MLRSMGPDAARFVGTMTGYPAEITELYDLPTKRDLRYLRPRAVHAMWRATGIFQREGLEAASCFLTTVSVRSPGRTNSLGQLQELAWRLRVIARLLRGEQLCLSESVAVAAGLRALGIAADIVIGHVTSLSMNTDPIHAWVAVGDEILTEDLLPGFYFEFARYPSHQALET